MLNFQGGRHCYATALLNRNKLINPILAFIIPGLGSQELGVHAFLRSQHLLHRINPDPVGVDQSGGRHHHHPAVQ
jgi:hypothetical protein